MDPVTLVIVPGVLGGLILACFVVLSRRRARPAPSVMLPYRPDRVSTDVINMASIKVAGIGGLGLVAMAAAVALDVPEIGQSVGLGLALGAVAAAIMIFRVRRTGPMPSSGSRMGANTVLSIDQPVDPDQHAGDHGTTQVKLASAT